MRLVVQADDFGLSAGSADRILAACSRGRIDRVAVVANGRAFRHAVRALRGLRRTRHSVHVNLVEGRPVSPRRSVPLLVDREGRFRHGFLSLGLASSLPGSRARRLRQQIAIEIAAQVGRVRRQLPARTVDIDSHRYVHLLPAVMDVILRQAHEWGIANVRTVNEPLFLVPSAAAILRSLGALNPLKLWLLRRLSRRCAPALRRRGIGHPDHTLGLLYSGAMSFPAVERGIACIQRRRPGPEAVVEIVFHPGRATPAELRGWARGPRAARFYASEHRDGEAEAVEQVADMLQRATSGVRRPGGAGGPGGPAVAPSWIDYWDGESIFAPMMRAAARHFLRRSWSLLGYSRTDVVLDFGCGPGYLEDLLRNHVREIHGVDTSPRLIAECLARFSGDRRLRFHLLDRDRSTDLSLLQPRRFTLAICLSVVQYFRQREDLIRLIESVRELAAPGARLLVADVPVRPGAALDAIELLRAAAAEGILPTALVFLWRSLHSSYRRVRAAVGAQWYPLDYLRAMIEQLDLEATIISEPLTLTRSRVHLLVRFPRGRPR